MGPVALRLLHSGAGARMTALVRASSLYGYEALAAELGLDGRAALRRFGLAARSVEDPTALVSYAAVVAMFEFSARELACPDFGLQLARRQGLGILGPVLALIRHAPTIGEALQLASRYLFVHSPSARLGVAQVDGQPQWIDLCFDIDIPGRPACAQACELSLALLNEGLQLYGMGRVRAVLAQFPHARQAGRAAYAREFGCECRFGAPLAALRIAAADLQQSLPERNPLMQQLAQQYLDRHFVDAGAALCDQVRALVRQGLGSGDCSRQSIARALGLHPRTLQRRLEAEGQRFDALLDSVRQELLLTLTSRHAALPLSQVAMMLGYSEQSALSRSCRRWFGCSPRELQLRRQAA